jgi:hypothetical protein
MQFPFGQGKYVNFLQLGSGNSYFNSETFVFTITVDCDKCVCVI